MFLLYLNFVQIKIGENCGIKPSLRIDRVKSETILSSMKSCVYKTLEKYLQLKGFKINDKANE